MNHIFLCMILAGACYALGNGEAAACAQAALEACGEALRMTMSLAGAFMFFSGVIAILDRAGAVRALVRALRRPLRRLFGKACGEEALEAIALNLAANMLGLGNAATPMGLKAARLLNAAGGDTPSAALCLLLVVNATSVQLAPTTVVALRAAAGSAAPEAIVLPTLLSSGVATAVGIVLCRLCERKR